MVLPWERMKPYKKKLMLFLKDKNLSGEQHRYFTILTAPVNQSFINEAEVSLLKGLAIN